MDESKNHVHQVARIGNKPSLMMIIVMIIGMAPHLMKAQGA